MISQYQFCLECTKCNKAIKENNKKRLIFCIVCHKPLCEECDTYGCCPEHFAELPIEMQKEFVITEKKVEKRSYHWKVIGLPIMLLALTLLLTRPHFQRILLPLLLLLFLFEWFNWNSRYITQYRRKKYLEKKQEIFLKPN
ncbi:hypothetical protein NEF87_003658 [Candidatus Lokiarchaeum ossiferum]|uniref:B box-type domain-containing protein n=1 Tax=Candidatus Lokiarchaeum ossiferum TaxID=2951803 RepID=A0ABY6HVL4_9ARCH|nr:hypothetical protein NEF87_003658 [Candidatus Lokiarchaeum sp. B-35]